MNERIRKLRRYLDKTQQEFADELGIKRNTVATYESGRNEPIDAVVSLICRTYGVNEAWLRTGEGEMFQAKDTSTQFADWADRALAGKDAAFRRRFVSAFMSLTDKEWELLERKVLELAERSRNSETSDIAAAEAAYVRSSRSAQNTASSVSNTTSATADEKAV